MSLYNIMNGVNPLALFLIPMLGDKHPDEYPRFRDVFLKDDEHPEYDNYIHLYTRVGGGNREKGYGEEKLYEHENYVATFDDSFDNTYASYVFSIPDKWKFDFEKITYGKANELSEDYKKQVLKVFPKMEDSLNKFFNS